MRKIWKILLVLMIISLPLTAQADKEFIQKIQDIIKNVQEKALAYQEQAQKLKDEMKNAAEQAKSYANDAKKLGSDIKSGIENVQNMDINAIKNTHLTVAAIPNPDPKKTDPDEAAGAVEEKIVPKTGEGDDDKNFEESQEKMQQILRQAVVELYAAGFTTRANMPKEKPRDVNMNDTNQMLLETNAKAVEVINRLAQIFTLESMLESYQYTQGLKTLTVDASSQTDEED